MPLGGFQACTAIRRNLTAAGLNLQLGSQGELVLVLQSRLETLGFELGQVDGDFGMKTLAAVKAFQRSKGLTADGIVGPQTSRALGLETQSSSGGTSTPPPKTPTTSQAAPPNVLGTPKWLEIAQNEVGQKELSGSNHNSRIIAYHASTSLKAKQDEVAWCASFVNWCLTQAGIKGTNSAAAASWASWGSACNARYGAVAVIYNAKAANSSLSTSGNHVGFLVDETATHYKLLGGNQSDQVKVSSFPKSKWKLKAYRWPNGVGDVSSAPKQPSAASSKPVQSKPAITAQYKSAAESLVRPFVTSLGMGMYSMDEEGVAKALFSRGKDVHLITAVFNLLDDKYNSDSDDIAILYLELVKSRAGAVLEMLKQETALRNLLIQILSTDIVTSEDAQAIRYLKDLAAQSTVSKPPVTSSSTQANKPGTLTKLTTADFERAAKSLGDGVSVAIIRAYAEVESGGRSGFGPKGLPIIAYEGHVFRARTRRRDKTYPYDRSHPMLSYEYKEKAGPEWRANNKNQETAWKTLTAAMALDHDAALMSCSWGMFQVMGFNYARCGYATVNDFVAAMKAGEPSHLDAFVAFCKNTAGLVNAIKARDFVQMAKLYNGKDYGDYDKRIAKAYKKYGGNS